MYRKIICSYFLLFVLSVLMPPRKGTLRGGCGMFMNVRVPHDYLIH